MTHGSTDPARTTDVDRCIDCFHPLHQTTEQDSTGKLAVVWSGPEGWVCDATGDEHRPQEHFTEAHRRAVKRVTEAYERPVEPTEIDDDCWYVDALTDLMHYCAEAGLNPTDAFASAERHFEAEWTAPDDLSDDYERDSG
jgi:hypothetical protein